MNAHLAFNALAVCGAASFAGAMLNIGLSFGAYWKSLPPAAFLDWFSMNGHFIGRTIPVFVIPTVIGLAASIWFDWKQPSARYLWLASLACIVGVGLITFAYHLPTNSTFASKTIALDQVAAALDQWLRLHTVRIALSLFSAVLGIVALSR